ncbi:Aldo-ket-red domain-containing protein [Mycena indigotica]|uniref:Aldo-ket-red domain-containing protein n=1 Tax=Mycena indigotica TaxID=2126181 RepID=A0A8H6VX41_9AGAR|nr:Aldo-ket-red domain-containing protein [Mycena indigotica]KAF7295096.1 Aldo-ket-red domain-containing protein [Mycena indigotica]
MQTSRLNVVMGAMTFGAPESGARVNKLEDVKAILDAFRSHGHTEIDSARTYCGGTSEEYLGRIDWKQDGFALETKLAPRVDITHSPQDLRKNLLLSLKALNADSIEMWYLHAPDHSTPYETTMKAVDDLYREGYFKRFGISNYAAWEVAEIVGICKANGYIQPTAYQGIYNVIHRNVEPELFPCLRKFGISFYEFNPLAGGFFTDRYMSLDDVPEPGSRFDPTRVQGKNYRQRYWNESYFKALSTIRMVVKEYNLTMAEVALRWLSHHSLMAREHGDSIIIGASNLTHIQQNLLDLEKGPLRETSLVPTTVGSPSTAKEVLTVLDEAWAAVAPLATDYFK